MKTREEILFETFFAASDLQKSGKTLANKLHNYDLRREAENKLQTTKNRRT